MQQEILSRTSLSTIISDPRLDLYKNERAKEPIEDVIEAMKRDIKINIIELPGSIMERGAASAFSIQFSYPESHKAQQVVQTLITKFTEANLNTQREQQNTVTSFVHDELTVAKAADALDEARIKFRVENTGKLPEESQMNIAQLTSLQQLSPTINDSLNREVHGGYPALDTHLETLQGQLELLGMFDKDVEITGPVARQNERLLMYNKQVTDAQFRRRSQQI